MKLNRLIGLPLGAALACTAHAQYAVVHNFTIAKGMPSGAEAPGVIAQGRNGDLFSTAPAQAQQSDQVAAAFRVTTSGTLNVLHKFNIWEVYSGLTMGRDGWFYGVTTTGGTHGWGSVFKVNSSGSTQILHNFVGGDEAHPVAPPVQAAGGQFLGTAVGQGSRYQGIVYKIDSSGNYAVLHTFSGGDGAEPNTPLIQGKDQWFYGTAQVGGAHGDGVIFRINASGQYQRLYSFDRANGLQPVGLIQANDGNFYGMTYQGGGCGEGVIFKLTPSWQYTVLHTFCSEYGNGGGPWAGLIQGTDGNLYGVTAGGGSNLDGVIFRMSTAGKFTVLYNFDRTHGVGPVRLIQHTNGNFYGLTAGGGSGSGGVLFRYNAGLKPFISYLNVYGKVGTTVEILGEGFTSSTEVLFNGVRAQVTSVSPTYLTAVVPKGATTGYITATTSKGTLKSNTPFVVH